MRHSIRLAVLSLAFAALAAAQPTILGLQNNYSYLLPGTPNYAFAQGGILIIYGQGMAPAAAISNAFPTLDRNLAGVSIKITVNGVTTEAVPYYVSGGQIAAILPSATPVGSGTITVAYNGATSAPFPIQVVQGAFGLLTMSGNGLGQAVVQDAGYNYHTPANAAQEGETVIFWGTGLGPDPNDETQLISVPQSLNSIPFELYIGNKPAEVLYHGRSQYPGLDQIVAKIPTGMTGCFVSAYVKTGDYISNFTTIPVKAAGSAGACSDTFADPDEIQRFSSQQSVTSGWLYIGKFNTYNPGASAGGIVVQPGTTITDSATAQFLRYTPFDYTNYGAIGQPSFGNCVVNNFNLTDPFTPPILEGLDAGDISLTLPTGAVQPMTKSNLTYFIGGGAGAGPLFVPDAGGTFTFTGSGGTQVGPFTASTNVSPAFTWNEETTIRDVSLSQSLTLTWSGADPDTYIIVTGLASDSSSVFTSFSCSERASVGRITIPRDILASMIPSFVNPAFPLPTGQILLYNYVLPTKFTASGIDNGNIAYFHGAATSVNFK